MNDYLRGAQVRMNLPVYDCECWGVGQPHINAPQFIVPFCVRVELGINAEVAAFKVRAVAWWMPACSVCDTLLVSSTAIDSFASTVGGRTAEQDVFEGQQQRDVPRGSVQHTHRAQPAASVTAEHILHVHRRGSPPGARGWLG